ncbi:MAG: DUF3037 domain-containing protein [Rhabdochlamydiaceae bacterium]
MKCAFSFSVLRYTHDIIGGEFVNIGVVVYGPDRQYLKSKISSKYARISGVFHGFDPHAYASYTHRLQKRINEHGAELETGWLFTHEKLGDLLKFYLPQDDSAYQFGTVRSGITEDLEKELQRLFARYVTKYVKPEHKEGRDDDAIWNAFRQQFPKKQLLDKLTEHTLRAPDYVRVFDNAWKNERWHFAEPLSLDLLDKESIIDKAHRWFGRIESLKKGNEDFKVHFLVGLPRGSKLVEAAKNAEHILSGAGKSVELIQETDVAPLVKEIEQDLAAHSSDNSSQT